MPVKIEINKTIVIANAGASFEKVRPIVASQVLKDCNLYCKEDTGALIQSSYIHSDLKNGLLIWQTPYAARQYYEIRTAYKDVNPKASWRWVEVAAKLHKEDWAKQAQAALRLYG